MSPDFGYYEQERLENAIGHTNSLEERINALEGWVEELSDDIDEIQEHIEDLRLRMRFGVEAEEAQP